MSPETGSVASLRLDKWLWHARFFKTRSRSAEVVSGGHVRVNARPVSKASFAVRPGDTLTFAQGRTIRVVRIVGIADRRGPAAEAQALYDDLSPPAEPTFKEAGAPTAERGRINRKDRRAGRLSKQGPLD
ncbi:RNA-binding S4 domain-containing protein [Rhodobacteraceae bacterium SC52]|nr:RNA-binding S4 domain-containing protein [Rhodobacteraceae bacterium SC52]